MFSGASVRAVFNDKISREGLGRSISLRQEGIFLSKLPRLHCMHTAYPKQRHHPPIGQGALIHMRTGKTDEPRCRVRSTFTDKQYMRRLFLSVVLCLPLLAEPKLVYTPEPSTRASVAKLLDTFCKSQGQLVAVITEGARNETLVLQSEIMFHSSRDRVLNFTMETLRDPSAVIMIKKCQFKQVIIRDFSGRAVVLDKSKL